VAISRQCASQSDALTVEASIMLVLPCLELGSILEGRMHYNQTLDVTVVVPKG
jgi:hypothetical protein